MALVMSSRISNMKSSVFLKVPCNKKQVTGYGLCTLRHIVSHSFLDLCTLRAPVGAKKKKPEKQVTGSGLCALWLLSEPKRINQTHCSTVSGSVQKDYLRNEITKTTWASVETLFIMVGAMQRILSSCRSQKTHFRRPAVIALVIEKSARPCSVHELRVLIKKIKDEEKAKR